jgi:hypothetical protein
VKRRQEHWLVLVQFRPDLARSHASSPFGPLHRTWHAVVALIGVAADHLDTAIDDHPAKGSVSQLPRVKSRMTVAGKYASRVHPKAYAAFFLIR